MKRKGIYAEQMLNVFNNLINEEIVNNILILQNSVITHSKEEKSIVYIMIYS